MRKILLFISILFIAGNIFAGTAQRRAKQVLNEVWDEVSRRHFDKNFKQQYQKLYKKFEPAILRCSDDKKLSREINKLLQALGQSHIVLMPPISANVSKVMSTIRKNTAPESRKKTGLQPDLPAPHICPGCRT